MKGYTIVLSILVLLNLTHAFVYEPKERQLLYKEPTKQNMDNFELKGRVLAGKPERQLGLMGPDDSQIVKIKAKKDMLKRKIEMDNGKAFRGVLACSFSIFGISKGLIDRVGMGLKKYI